jgi:hypothetical protein
LAVLFTETDRLAGVFLPLGFSELPVFANAFAIGLAFFAAELLAAVRELPAAAFLAGPAVFEAVRFAVPALRFELFDVVVAAILLILQKC